MAGPRLIAGGLAGAMAYLALAVAGEGGLSAFLAQPALVTVATITFILTGIGFLSSANISPGEREDRGNRWVLAAFGVIFVLAGFLPAYTDRIDFWTLDGAAIRWLGVVLYAAGGALRLWPVFVLGRRFSGLVAIQPGHRLVTSGIYGSIRHPSYLGLLVNALGWGLAFRSGFGVLLAAAALVPLVARIRAEERLLLAQFGAEYAAYRARTARLVPGVW